MTGGLYHFPYLPDVEIRRAPLPGARVIDHGVVCTACRMDAEDDHRYCRQCGADLNETGVVRVTVAARLSDAEADAEVERVRARHRRRSIALPVAAAVAWARRVGKHGGLTLTAGSAIAAGVALGAVPSSAPALSTPYQAGLPSAASASSERSDSDTDSDSADPRSPHATSPPGKPSAAASTPLGLPVGGRLPLLQSHPLAGLRTAHPLAPERSAIARVLPPLPVAVPSQPVRAIVSHLPTLPVGPRP